MNYTLSNVTFATPCFSNYTMIVHSDLDMFFILFSYVTTLVISILCHELGHLFILRRYFKSASVTLETKESKFKLYAGTEEQFKQLSANQKILIYVAGILAGLLYILFSAIFYTPLILVTAPYLVGCWRDITYIWKNIKVFLNDTNLL
jgi:hypothetical protein